MEYREETLRGFDVVGIQIRTRNSTAMETIGPLWERFHAEHTASRIPHPADERLLAVYSAYESDHTGAYHFLIGQRVQEVVGTLPDHLTCIRVPPGRYAVVAAREEMPGALVKAWLGPPAPRAGGVRDLP